MLRRRWKLLVGLTLAGLVIGSLAAVRASDDAADPEVPVFYAANHRLLADPQSPNAISLQQAALFATAGEVPTRVAAELGRDRFDVLARIATITAKDVETLTLSAVGATPDEASIIATTFAEELVAFLLEQDQAAFSEAVSTTEAEVAEHLAVIEALDAQIAALQPEPIVPEDGVEIETPAPTPDPQLDLLEAERSSRLGAYENALAQLEEIRANPPRAAFNTLEISEPFTISEAAYQRRLRAGRTGEANYTSSDQLDDGRRGFASSVADNPVVLVSGGSLAGLLLGMVVALALARLDHRILTKEEAEEHYGLPVIAEIPRLRRSERRSSDVVSFTEPMSRVAEAYRSLRSSLVYSREVGERAATVSTTGARRPEVVMVTSANAAEGKTSTAANLAAVLAEAGYSVLALNCDFRRPQLVHYLKGDPEPRKIADTEIDGVMLINHVTAEASDALPSDVVKAQRQVIERARGRYDVILLDTAPLLATNDANELLPSTDLILIVVQVGRSTKEAGEATRELLERRGAPVVGIVLLGVREAATAKSYYYYSSERPSRPRTDDGSRSKRARRRRARAVSETRGSAGSSTDTMKPALESGPDDPAPVEGRPAADNGQSAPEGSQPLVIPGVEALGSTQPSLDDAGEAPADGSSGQQSGPGSAAVPEAAIASSSGPAPAGLHGDPGGDLPTAPWAPDEAPAVARRRRRRRTRAPVSDSAAVAGGPSRPPEDQAQGASRT